MMSEKERLYIAVPRDGKEMVNRCVAAGCSNTPSNRVSLLHLPNDGILRRICEKQVQRTVAQSKSTKRIWEKQVQRTVAQWKSTKHSPFFVVMILLRTCFEGGGLPWRSGMEGREVVFLVPATRWRPVAGRSRTDWYWWLRW